MLKRWFIGVLFAIALIAAACGDSDDDTSTGTDPADGSTTTSEPADGATSTTADTSTTEVTDNGGATDDGVTEDEVRIAIVSEKTGSVNATSNGVGFDDGFEAYIEKINEEGGVHGREIVIVAELDDMGDANLNNAHIQQAINQEGAFMIVGCFSKFGGRDFLEQQQIPTIGCNHDPVNWEGSEWALGGAAGGNWLDETPDDDPPSEPSATVAYVMGKLGLTKLGVFSYNHPGSRSVSEDQCTWIEENYGMECVYEDYSLEFGFVDIGASLQQLIDSGAEFIYGGMDTGGGLTIVRSLKRGGLDLPTMWAVGLSEDDVQSSTDLIDSFYYVSPAPPYDSDNEAMVELREELEFRKPGVELSQPVLNGWNGANLLVDGMREAGPNLTHESLHSAIRSFDSWGTGLGATIDFTTSPEEKIRQGIEPDPTECSWFLMRGYAAEARAVQVGEKPLLCIAGIDTPEELQAKLAEDDSSLDPADQ